MSLLPMVPGTCLMKFLLVYSESSEPFRVPLSCVFAVGGKAEDLKAERAVEIFLAGPSVVSLAEIVIN